MTELVLHLERKRGTMEFLPEDLFTTRTLISLLGFCGAIWFVVYHLSNNEKLCQIRQRRKLRSQGINGPPPSFLHGNTLEMQRITRSMATKPPNHLNRNGVVTEISHDYTASVFPHFSYWAQKYGQVYTYTIRNRQHLYVSHPDLVREISQNMSMDLGKPGYLTKQLAPLFGNGILRSNGPLWSQQRRIIAPEFYMEKLKAMMGLMTEAAELLVRKWEAGIEAKGEGKIELSVDEDLRNFSADVIARACFGSSFYRGKEIFSKIRTLQKIMSGHDFLFKSSKFSLTKSDNQREIQRLEKEVETLIWETVKERVRESKKNHDQTKDVMQLILEGANNNEENGWSSQDSKQFIIDNCKNIYFAGYETTAISSAWCLLLFSVHPQWQDRVRQEVAEHYNHGQLPSFDALNKMKWLNMFIQETLRLYSPGAFVTREALKELRLGDLVVPKGVVIFTLIPALHRDPEIWGPDVLEFKPERFADGVSNACKNPHAYLPFGAGARNCLGKNFAMIELKLILCLLLSNFSFSLSPKYKHSPDFKMVIEPGHGVHLVIKKNG